MHDQSQFILFSRLKALSRVRTTANDLYVSVEGVVDVSMWLSRVCGCNMSRLKAFPGLQERGLLIAGELHGKVARYTLLHSVWSSRSLLRNNLILLVLQRVGFRPTSTCVSCPSASTRTAGTSTSCTTSSRRPMGSDVPSLSDWMCSRCLFDRTWERPRVDADVLLRNKMVLPLRRFGIRGT